MADNNSQWKQKYYNSLDELEKREKKWQAVEELFKQAISRLSLAAEGKSENLDNDLGQLRTAIRKSKDNHVIQAILESVSKEIIRLDKIAKSEPGGDAGLLLKIIQQLQLSGKAEKKSRALVKQLKAKNPPGQSELIQQFTGLLSEIVKLAILESEKSKDAVSKNKDGGLLKSLFSGAKKDPSAMMEPATGEESLASKESSAYEEPSTSEEPSAIKEPSASEEPSANKEPSASKQPPVEEGALSSEKSSAIEQPATAKEPLSGEQASVSEPVYEVDDSLAENQSVSLNQEQLTSVVSTVQSVLESIIDGLDLDDQTREQLKDKVFEVKPTKEIHILLADLKDVLHGAGILDKEGDQFPADIAEHHELLIRLIEFLPLEESVKEQAEELKNDFSKGVSTEQLPQALQSIASLISQMRSIAFKEQKEFELFLKNLTGRLKEVDNYLQSNLQEHQQSYQSGLELDNAVKDQVREIGDSVAAITNLAELEQSIQAHLDQIINHVNRHRNLEDERVSRIEAQNKQLSEQLQQLESESSKLRKQVIDSQNKAMLDPLTQLPNRLAYDQRLNQEYARWKRYNSTLLIMVWDIDFFKQVNDTYGHQAGDKVLKVVANLLRENLRETDFVSRFGGEEFVSLMPETTLGGGFKVAEKIRNSVEKLEFHYRGDNVNVTISCGISLFMENDTHDSAFARADKALYQAKEQGRNRCVIAKEP